MEAAMSFTYWARHVFADLTVVNFLYTPMDKWEESTDMDMLLSLAVKGLFLK